MTIVPGNTKDIFSKFNVLHNILPQAGMNLRKHN